MMKDPFQRGRIDAYVRRTTARTPLTRWSRIAGLAAEYARVVNEVARGCSASSSSEVTFTLHPAAARRADHHGARRGRDVRVADRGDGVPRRDRRPLRDAAAGGDRAARGAVGLPRRGPHAARPRSSRCPPASTIACQRLEVRIKRMVGDRFDPYRIAQEVALLADKADVSEEIARLRSHCDQFGEAVGRRARGAQDGLPAPGDEPRGEHHRVQGGGAPDQQRVVDMKSSSSACASRAANIE
jgi:hypothetical protein